MGTNPELLAMYPGAVGVIHGFAEDIAVYADGRHINVSALDANGYPVVPPTGANATVTVIAMLIGGGILLGWLIKGK